MRKDASAVTGMAVAFAAAIFVLLSAAAPAAAASTSARLPVSDTAPPTNNSIGVRILDVPVDLRDDPRARDYIIDNLLPGTTISRRIEVSNGTTSALRATLYPAAATITGGAFVGSVGHTPNDACARSETTRRAGRRIESLVGRAGNRLGTNLGITGVVSREDPYLTGTVWLDGWFHANYLALGGH